MTIRKLEQAWARLKSALDQARLSTSRAERAGMPFKEMPLSTSIFANANGLYEGASEQLVNSMTDDVIRATEQLDAHNAGKCDHCRKPWPMDAGGNPVFAMKCPRCKKGKLIPAEWRMINP